MKPRVLIGVVTAALLVGVGGWFAYGLLVSPAVDDAINLIPQDSKLYANVILDPSNDQKRAIRAIIEASPFETPERVQDKLTELFDEGLREQGCAFEEDVEPWLGRQIAGFITDFSEEPDGAALVATEDEDAALAAFEKCGDEDFEDFDEKSYRGFDYRASSEGETLGAVDGYLVLATEAGFKSVVDTAEGGPSLRESEQFQEARARHSSDNVAFFYLDVNGVIESLQASGQMGPAEVMTLRALYGTGGVGPLTFVLFAESKAMVLEYAADLPSEGAFGGLTQVLKGAVASDVVPALPGGAWGAIGIGSLGDYIDATLDFVAGSGFPGGRARLESEFRKETGLSLNEDVLSWIGDAGMFIQGASPQTLSGGLVIETSDAAASVRALDVLKRALEEERAVQVKRLRLPGLEGFSVQDETMPQPVNIVVGNGKVVVAYSDLATQQALESDVTLGDSEVFRTAQAAVGEDFAVQGFFDMDPIQELVETAVIPSMQTLDPATGTAIPDTQAQQQYEEDVKPFLDPLSFVAFGSKLEGNTTISRFVVGVE